MSDKSDEDDISLLLDKEKIFFIFGSLMLIHANSQDMVDGGDVEENAISNMETIETMWDTFGKQLWGKDDLQKEFIEYTEEQFGIEITMSGGSENMLH